VGFRLTRYARRELVLATLVTGVLITLSVILAVSVSRLLWVAVGLAVLTWVWVLWFFRDPDREAPEGDGLVVSPADGKVTDVTLIGPESALGREGVQVGIFMNIFDVHVNRSPCSGLVEKVEHRPGAFLDARNPAASQRNTSATVIITHHRNGASYPVVVRQIAGLIARRIVTDLSQGRRLTPGERIGMIKFGSRVEVLVPRELVTEVHAKVGQRVKAGRSILLSAVTKREDDGNPRDHKTS